MIDIKLQWKYLKHDIDQWTWRLAQTRISDANVRYSVQNGTESDTTFFIRKISEALSEIQSKYYSVVNNVIENKDDTLNKSQTEWVVKFDISERSFADSNTITNLMHKYVVRRVIYWWAEIYAPDSLQAILSDANEDDIESILLIKAPEL